MPPLHKLITKPSSLNQLRHLIPTAAWNPYPVSAIRNQRHVYRHFSAGRQGEFAVISSQEAESYGPGSTYGTAPPQSGSPQGSVVRKVGSTPRSRNCGGDYGGPWKESHWTEENLEFESNLGQPTTSKLRLLEHPDHRNDMRLFAFLLDYRQRRYGRAGVSVFWDALSGGNLQLPVYGVLANKLWRTFLNFVLQDGGDLQELLRYADRMLDSTGLRWPQLYVTIIQYMLLYDRGTEGIKWHHQLVKRHPPDPRSFSDLCRQVVLKKGDLRALRNIYEMNEHRNMYSIILPILCEQEDYKAALEWHFFLLGKGDLPAYDKTVDPLVHFLAVYDQTNAIKVTQSLVDAGVPFGPSMSAILTENKQISREMINLIHGETFHISVKEYNDSLGARWFATRWISLDTAINAVHALGVQEIGPLSLQAIALREPVHMSIHSRINQLADLGISIGTSLYSRAVAEFARTRQQVFLLGLLKSDQHPDALEDWKLQEALLASYAIGKDWIQYRRTLAIRLIGSKCPNIDAHNVILRSHITRGDMPAILSTLFKMQLEGTVVTVKTITYLIQQTLGPRRPGRRPITSHPKSKMNDLQMVISILKDIMKSGSFVPVTSWREIIRRLGMTGKSHDLNDLSIFLVSWYGPQKEASFHHSSPLSRRAGHYHVPVQVPTSHPLHPLKILFPRSLQKAIAEWGFIRALRAPPKREFGRLRLIYKDDRAHHLTSSGIVLLRRLQQHGVHIDMKSVRSAIFNRLVTYYGRGQSSKKSNRVAKAVNSLTLEEMARQSDEALGTTMFTRMDLRQEIESRAEVRIRRQYRKRQRRMRREQIGPFT